MTFLFAGPYRKRQILGYKLFTTVMLCLFSAAFFTLMSSMVSPRLISAFVGSFVMILFLQTLQMVVGLAANTLGALAWSRGRRLVLAGLFVVVGLAILSVGRELGRDGTPGSIAARRAVSGRLGGAHPVPLVRPGVHGRTGLARPDPMGGPGPDGRR